MQSDTRTKGIISPKKASKHMRPVHSVVKGSPSLNDINLLSQKSIRNNAYHKRPLPPMLVSRRPIPSPSNLPAMLDAVRQRGHDGFEKTHRHLPDTRSGSAIVLPNDSELDCTSSTAGCKFSARVYRDLVGELPSRSPLSVGRRGRT
jgi:hypothetical protein